MSHEKRLDRGIYKTDSGFRVYVRIGTKLESKRFPPTYTLDKLRQWRADHVRERRPKRSARGTLAADVEVYLNAVAAMPTYTDRVREISAWLPAFGQQPRWMLKPEAIRIQLAQWRAEGYAPNTCNHRRTALSHLYSVLDGKAAYNPLRDVPAFPLPPPVKRGVPMATVVKVLKQIHGPKTRARLEVLAWTGLRPSELMRLTPALVNLKRGTALVPTAKGGPPREIAFGLAKVWWKKLIKVDGLGAFSVQSMRKPMRAACKKVGVPPLRIYDLRHSFLSALRQSGADLSDVQAQAGHSDIALTRRYAPTITVKLTRAVNRLR